LSADLSMDTKGEEDNSKAEVDIEAEVDNDL
jgi:hypothetical protein